MKKIDSFSNKSLKWVKKLLADSKQRKLENLAVIETKKIFVTFLEHNNFNDVVSIFVTNEFLLENKKLLHKFNDAINIVKNDMLDSISSLKTPDGIVAVVKQTKNEIVYDKAGNYLALYNLQNPHNLGAIIRSSLAFGIKGIYLIGSTCDLYHPETIRSSMGYCFAIPTIRFNSFDYFLANVKKNNMVLLATALSDNSINLFDYHNKTNNCFIIGNEGQGLPENVLTQCDKTIKIPLMNNVESLNASVAASIVAFWLKYENN